MNNETNTYDVEFNQSNNESNNNIIVHNNNENKLELYKLDIFKKNSCLSNNNYIIQDFDLIYNLITNINSLNIIQKNIILLRFSHILCYCLDKFNNINLLYKSSKFFILTVSIICPALLGIIDFREKNNNDFTDSLFWIIWVLLILLSLVNAYLNFYKWDKKYILFSLYKKKINQEFWNYIELIGKYSDDEESTIDHNIKFDLFMTRIESIFKKLNNNLLEIETSDENNNENQKNFMSALNPTPTSS